MRWTSFCTIARLNGPRDFDCTSCTRTASLTLRLPSKLTRLMTEFSTTVTIRPPPVRVTVTSSNRPVA
jgi:hypothetical protein